MGWRTKTRVKQYKSIYHLIEDMWRVSKILSKIKANQPMHCSLKNLKGRSRRKSNKKSKLCLIACIRMFEYWSNKNNRKKTPRTLYAHISSKGFVKKERNVFTHMIWPLIGMKKSICMLIKELNLLWTKLVLKIWMICHKKSLESLSATNRNSISKEQNLT